ncbi:non-ribosomal peptide synthetase, partial [Hymenobacter lucidus]
QYWQQQQQAYAQSSALAQQLPYWQHVANQTVPPLPVEEVPGIEAGTGAVISQSLSAELTSRLLTQSYAAYHTDSNDVLLTGLGLALRATLGVAKVRVQLEGHGREALGDAALDVSRTVGWFTTTYPVVLDLSHGPQARIRQLIEVKETLHRVPNKGLGYGVLTYLGGQQPGPAAEVTFNYLGDFGGGVAGTDEKGPALFTFSEESSGREVSPLHGRTSLLDGSALVVGGQLSLMVSYDAGRLSAATMQQLVAAWAQELEQLLEALAQEQPAQLTPVDLTFKDLSVENVWNLAENFSLEDVCPLSPLQQGLYYHWLNLPEAYFEQTAYQLQGELNINGLQQSYDKLVARHAMLRTCFTQAFGPDVLQIVQKQVPSGMRYIDVSNDKTFSLAAFKEADRQAGFDLRQGSQMRLTVLALGQHTHEFIWSHHHILMDGWCTGVLIKEFFQIYQGFIHNEEPQLGKVHPYSNYLKWLLARDTEAAQHYWQQYLQGYDTVSSLPKLLAKDNDGFELHNLSFTLSQPVSQAVKSLCEDLRITENTFVQTAWALLLSRYNQTNDVVFGAVVSGRPAEIEGIEETIGLFINTIPVRVQTSAGVPVRELLQSVQQRAIEGTDSHYTQLADIQANSDSGRALFDHIVVFENYPVAEMVQSSMDATTSNVTLQVSDSFEQTNYDFTLIVVPGEATRFQFKYNSLVYDAALMSRLQEHFTRIIEQVAANPALTIEALDYLSPDEKEVLVETFNATTTVYPADKTIIELFEEQVAQYAAQPALVHLDSTFTYQQLDERANQLAWYLRTKYAIAPNELVAIRLERSADWLITILGVLKAGGAYLPLDPEYPEERIAYMLTDSECRVLLDEAQLRDFHQQADSFSKEQLPAVNQARDLAYVMYTSGSTGRPKGVMIEHRSVVRLVRNTNYVPMRAGDQLLQTGSLSFDATTFELWGMLLNGGTLHLVPQAHLLDIQRLKHYLLDAQITTAWFTSFWFNQLVDLDLELFSGLKYILVGGDKLSPRHIKAVKEAYPALLIVNGYGPTENTTFSLCHPIEQVTDQPIPIGSPIANSTAYVLDARQQLCGVGVVGEICLGGAGLARGYLNQPELTAEKFIAHPFQAGERLYRTGDLGRWLPDGTLEFVGRVDAQIKIRGYRVELGEIEAVLQSHSDVATAVVQARTDAAGDSSLVAYVVSKQELPVAQLRAYMNERLPAYMVPAYFVELEALPLNANGKLDRHKLPAVQELGFADEAEYTESRTELEAKLVVIWEEILGKEKISVTTNFFELGGHSLKAMRLLSQIHKEFDVQLSFPAFFANPTIEGIAGEIEKTYWANNELFEVGEVERVSI